MTFSESPPEIVPTPSNEESSEEAEDEPDAVEERAERIATINAEDGHFNIRGRRSKRNRAWIWRPMTEDLSGSGGEVQESPVTHYAKSTGEEPGRRVPETTSSGDITSAGVSEDLNMIVKPLQTKQL